MNLFQETKFIMNKYNVTANKSYGQNFLTDEYIVNSIIDNSLITKDDLVIEVGPGLGTLTKYLIESAGHTISVELDPKMITVLKDRFSLYDNFTLLHDDILKVDLNSLIQKTLEEKNLKRAKVVANLPYYITTPIIMKLLEEKLNLDSITVMVQKEVAERLAAKPGKSNTGSITYTIWYYTEPEIILDVPKDSFVPSPKVDSAVLKLNVLQKPRVQLDNEELFFKIIKAGFMQKRKTLLNSLSNSNIASKDVLEKMLTDLNIDVRIRAENLSLDDFKNITDYLLDFKN